MSLCRDWFGFWGRFREGFLIEAKHYYEDAQGEV